MRGLTFDTGALIALERRQQSMVSVYTTAQRAGVRITVPTVVLAEWWRAGAGRRLRERVVASVHVEDLTKRIATLAGEALGVIVGTRPDQGTIDGIVMTSAWLRGDVIYTTDVGDMGSLRAKVPAFAGVRIEHA
jgi:predicted nucleic acid-binding protein